MIEELKDFSYIQNIMAYSLDMICTVNQEGCFVSMSNAVEDILGYKIGEVLGRNFADFVHPDDSELAAAKAEEILSGIPARNFVNRCRHKNGTYVYLSWSSFWSEENDLIYGIARDVTEIKIREQKIHDREAALSRSVSLLTQQNQQLKSFNHILTHNLRNHANNIAMLTSFLDRETLGAGNIELVLKLEKVSQKLTGTINDLSEAIKIRERVIESDRIPLEAATAEVLKILAMDLNYLKAEVVLAYDIAEINFPKIYFESLLTNLISNSLKYKRATERPLIHIAAFYDEDRHCNVLTYEDNGIGIDLDRYGDQIFGLYKTFTHRQDSHGVGLFLVKTQVESQGGSITIESRPDEGTRFTIFFKP
ncbi:PAS domain S-box protein [Mucilaginibacter sp. Bleaf8]|uniref:sensor histidine kinase n=1 Tax=Mucilaginibacter sp. Bleaf8 TaxID=2834430 RepID=UPI001BCB1296|nr:PAS domain S-box protein [Mucilaginibacter sp. Bleaf8]MBS7566691.1 PAS domain S-box protein [Mucilaginibacter sp. Bleaf8]